MRPVEVALIASMFLAPICVIVVVRTLKAAHVRRQYAIADHCRALYLLAVAAFEAGNEQQSRGILQRIRRTEWLWRLGNSWDFKVAKFASSVAIGGLVYFACRSVAIWMLFFDQPSARGVDQADINIAFVLVAFAALHSISAYASGWHSPWKLTDLGDRLEQQLDADRDMVLDKDRPRQDFADLTPAQILGIRGFDFTAADVDRAWRRLAAIYHPDRWQQAAPGERKAAEDAMKRINAARDTLKKGL